MRRADLPAGPIEYSDSGGEGPTLVLFHGLLMTGSLWDEVVAGLPSDLRIIRPTWPVGAHRLPMNADADLSLRGHARLIAAFLETLDLHDVTLVFNDWCGAQVLIAEGLDERVGRLVLASVETADNYPPGLPGRTATLAARIPGGVNAALQAMRLRPLRRLPMTFGRMSKRPVPDDRMDRWLAPGTVQRAIRRDLVKYAGDIANGQRALSEASAALARFDKPVLVLWAGEDRVMPLESGRRLAGSFADADFRIVPDSGNLIPIDQPERLAAELAAFVGRRPRGEISRGTAPGAR